MCNEYSGNKIAFSGKTFLIPFMYNFLPICIASASLTPSKTYLRSYFCLQSIFPGMKTINIELGVCLPASCGYGDIKMFMDRKYCIGQHNSYCTYEGPLTGLSLSKWIGGEPQRKGQLKWGSSFAISPLYNLQVYTLYSIP